MAASTAYYTAAALSPAQAFDQWDEIMWLQRWFAGEAHWTELWRLHNEHSLLFPRFLILADLLLLHGSNALLNWSSLLLQAVTAGLFVRSAWRATALPRASVYFLVGAYPIMLLSAVQMESFAWGFANQKVLMLCASVASIMCFNAFLTSAQRGVSTRRGLWWSWAAAFVATFSMVDGILTWPVLVLLALSARANRRDLVLLGVAAAGTIGLRLGVGWFGSGMSLLVSEPLRLARYAVWFFGTPFRHVSLGWVQGMGTFGLCAFVGILAYYAPKFRRVTAFERAQLGILLFAGGSGLATSLGRMSLPLDIVLNTRYATPALIFWAAVVSLLVTMSHRLARGQVWVPRLMQGAVALVLLCRLIPAHRVAGPAQVDFTRGTELSTLALIVGVEHRPAYAHLYPRPVQLATVVPFTRERRLGLFRTSWAAYMHRPVQEVFAVTGVFDPVDPQRAPRLGQLEALTPLEPLRPADPVPPGAQVTGWAWDVGPVAAPRLIVIADAGGVIQGLALGGLVREDIAARYGPELPGTLVDAGWAGFVATREGAPFTAYAVGADGVSATPLALARAPH